MRATRLPGVAARCLPLEVRRELCRLNRTRLCDLGVVRLGEANGIMEGGKVQQVQRGKLRLY